MAANPSIQLGTDGNWAIKEDNLLAYKKDGDRFFNKEFDFTRGSLATFVDKDGLIKYSGVTDTELVTNGSFDTDSDWIKGAGWTISGGTANYADSSISPLYQNITLNISSYELKFTISNSSGNGASIWIGNSSGSVNYTGGTYQYYTDGDYTLTINVPSSQTTLTFYGHTQGSSFSIDNVSVKEIQTDVPRIDFTDDATGHLLLEPQRTNNLLRSEEFDNASWTKFSGGTGIVPVVTANYTTSPDGSNNADRVVFDKGSGTGGSDLSQMRQIVSDVGQGVSSVYIKSNTSDSYTMGIDPVGNATLITITPEWQRFTYSETTNDRLTIGLRASQTSNYADVSIWGAQMEAGNYATSYIPTSGSAATRNAEVCNNSGSAQDFNDSEGVLYAEISSIGNDGVGKYYSISDGTSSNRIRIGYSFTDNTIRALVISQGSSAVDYTHTVSDVKSFSKVGFSYKQNEFSFWIDGVKAYTDTSGNTPTGLNSLQFENGNGGGNFYGKTKNLKVFKRAMSDGELYLLTVPQYQSYQEMATALNYTL